MAKYNYKPALLNIVESEETFTHTLGEVSDIVQKEMYRFTDQGGNSLVLRPEGTALALRFILGNQHLMNGI